MHASHPAPLYMTFLSELRMCLLSSSDTPGTVPYCIIIPYIYALRFYDNPCISV